MGKPFRDRDPVKVGAIGLVVLVLGVLGAFRADQLPLIGGGDAYYAEFAEAGGLKANDPVLVAGVRVGKVTGLALDGDHVLVSFRIDRGTELGTATRAEIKVKTILGAMFLSLASEGDGRLEEGATIPLERTTSPFQIVDAFSGLAERSSSVDTDQLTSALRTLADLTHDTPDEFRRALRGVSRLSSNLAARDQRINELLRNMERVSRVLADRDKDVVRLMAQASVLFRALVARRIAVHDLLSATSRLSRELSGLIRDSRGDLNSALSQLETVVEVLLKNQENLDEALRLYAPFVRVFANVTGDGPWLEGYVQNIPPAPQVGSAP